MYKFLDVLMGVAMIAIPTTVVSLVVYMAVTWTEHLASIAESLRQIASKL